MSIFEELKRRNVIRVGIAYAVVGWLVAQVAEFATENFGAPEWVLKIFVVFVLLGLPVVLIFAWAFEMTPEGLKREKDVDRNQSITPRTGRKLDWTIIAVMAIALVYFIWESRFTDQHVTTAVVTAPATQEAPAQQARSADNSIAVLPFANRSNLEDDLFFTDGIHDDLLTQLAKIKDLKVISRTSVMEYRDTTKKIPEIARELGVSTILEGGIQRAGKRVRINAQLIDVTTDEHLWAETFDREMTIENLFDIQSEITRQIVTAVKGELSETDQGSFTTAPTDNLDAYEAYLQAKAAINRPDYSPKKYKEAQPWAERAAKFDPEFAEAWAMLAEIHAQAVWQNYDNTPQRRDAALNAINTAVQLSPGSATVKAAQADYLYRFDNDYPAALAKYQQAHDIAPGDGRIILHMAFTLRRMGLWTDSVKSFEKALEVDPGNVYIVGQLVDTLVWMNQWERVDREINALVSRYPDSGDLKGFQIQAKIYHQGDLKAARELFDLLPPRQGYVYADTAIALTFMERDYDAVVLLLNTPELTNNSDRFGNQELHAGQAYLFAGEENEAINHFEQSIDDNNAWQTTGTYLDALRLNVRALTYAYLGDFETALKASQQAMDMMPQERDHIFGSFITNDHILILGLAGQRDTALQQLKATLDQPAGFSRWGLYLHPAWDFFRDDERFNELIRPKNLGETEQ